MRKMFDDDLSLNELKSAMKRLLKKQKVNYVLLGAVGVLLFICIIAVIAIKLKGCCCCDDEYDDFDDFDDLDDDDDDDDDSDECDCCDKDFED